MGIGTTFPDGFKDIFEEIKLARPDLNNNSEIAKEAVRTFWKMLNKKEEKSVSKKAPAEI